jgi:hypothetical protein
MSSPILSGLFYQEDSTATERRLQGNLRGVGNRRWLAGQKVPRLGTAHVGHRPARRHDALVGLPASLATDPKYGNFFAAKHRRAQFAGTAEVDERGLDDDPTLPDELCCLADSVHGSCDSVPPLQAVVERSTTRSAHGTQEDRWVKVLVP